MILSPQREIFENPKHMNAASTHTKRKHEYGPVNDVIFYLKADLVATSDDGFMESF